MFSSTNSIPLTCIGIHVCGSFGIGRLFQTKCYKRSVPSEALWTHDPSGLRFSPVCSWPRRCFQ